VAMSAHERGESCPVRAGALDDLVAMSAHERGESCPVRAGALDSECDDLPEPSCPLTPLPIPAAAGIRHCQWGS
jgi:hypothetical protein